MSDTDNNIEQKEIEETVDTGNKSPFTLEESDKHEELIEEDHNKPIDSYASMIYFKDKNYIKEEPSSPSGVDCWKSEDHQSSSPGGILDEDTHQNADGMKMHEELSQRTAKVGPINSSNSVSSYTNKSCSSPTISSSNEYISTPSSSLKEKDSQGIPRKPLTPYMSYRNMIFEEIKHKYPGCSPYDLACLISSKWSMLTDSERKVWEDQYEDAMKKYNDALRKIASNPGKRDWVREKKAESQPPPPIHLLKLVGPSRNEEMKNTTMGMCKWCRKFTGLQDFTSVLEGREIYCTGLCSEKCFIEAAKQINSIEGSGSSKSRYTKYSQSKTSISDDIPIYSLENRYSSSSTQSPLVADLVRSSKTSLFDWDSYLSMDTQSTAAHLMYFKQARYPPPNNFVIGMKLEACSYNASNMLPTFSLATVLSTCGARILLHFDGSDSKSDIWRLPDSGDIHPVGWTEGSLLKAPLGYKYDPAKYNKYFATNLQSAEIAPARLFKKEPLKPMENYFTVGMKLEAVNKQNPSTIGVASIVDVEGEQVKIEFDGYKRIGYWCHYYDRDLFPAGWCSRTGHPIQPPGNKVSQIYRGQSQSSSSPPPSIASTEPRSPLLPSSSTYQREQRESVSSTWKEKAGSPNRSPNSVEVFISMNCYCGPYIEASKLNKLSRVYKGNMVIVLKNVLEEVIKCAIDPKTVFGFLKPGRGNCVIKAICDGVAFQCCLNSIDRVSTFWRVLEQFSDNLRCCPNMFLSTDLRVACTRCNNNRARSVPISSLEYHRLSTHHGKRHHQHHSSLSNYLPSSSSHRMELSNRNEQLRHVTSRHERLSHTHSYSMSSYDFGRRGSEPDSPIVISTNSGKDSVFEPQVRTASSMETILQPSEEKTIIHETRYDSEKEDVTVDDLDEPVPKKKKFPKKKVDGIDISTAPKSWSIDDVINFIQKSDLKDYVNRFRENEIDGKALLLLQRDLVLSHMGFKLGPAVKLLDMIEELKTIQENFS